VKNDSLRRPREVRQKPSRNEGDKVKMRGQTDVNT